MILETEKKYQVVIVDNDLDLLDMLVYAFKAHHMDVKTFSSGKEASDYLSHQKNFQSTDLVVLERLLPDMDGIELIQSFSEKKNAPLFLILSQLEAEKDVLEGLELGAVEYLTKPFSLAVLMDSVQALLLRYRKWKSDR